MELRGNHPKDLWPGVKAWWGREYNEHPLEYTDLFTVDTSDKAWEEYVQDRTYGLAPIKPESADIVYDAATQGYTTRLTHLTYALGGSVSREKIDDGQYLSRAKIVTSNLAFSMRQTEENVGAMVYNRAFTGGYTGGDGVVLGSASHPMTGGTYSNILSVAAPLSETAVEDLIKLIMAATNDRGLKIRLMPKSLHVPPALYFDAQRIINTAGQTGTANNDINVIKAIGLLPDGVKVNHFFTSTTAWFIRTNAPQGMIWLNRVNSQFDQDTDFDSKDAKMSVYRRFSCGWVDPRAVYGTPGA